MRADTSAGEFPVLDCPVSQETLQDLREMGALRAPVLDEAVQTWRASLPWATWADRLLLILGSVLILAGVIFFFAYNWSAIPRLGRMGLVEGALVLCAAAAWRTGLERLVGQVLVLACAILVGVFLAVFGQCYQTGADSYLLFVTWAALITPWMLAARFGAVFILWLALCNLSLILYFDQVLHPVHGMRESLLLLLLALLDGGALLVREWGTRHGIRWMAEGWLRSLLLLVLLADLTVAVEIFIVDRHTDPGYLGLTVGYVVMLLVAYAWYRHRERDLSAICLLAFSACITFLSMVARIVTSSAHHDGAAILFLSVVVLGTVTATAWGLTWLGARMREEVTPPP